MTTLGPSGHAILGGSPADRWLNCDGYKQAVAHLPESPGSIYSVEGDNGHALVEHCLRHGDNPKDWIGNPWLKPKDGFNDTYSAELVEMVGHCITSTLADFEPTEGDRLYLEHPIVLSSIDAELWGSADVMIVKPSQKLLIVKDHKFGKGKIVDPTDNAQGAFYIVGGIDTLRLGWDWAAEFHVNQPRIDPAPQVWNVGSSTIHEWRGVFRRGWKRNNAPNAVRTAGEHCGWCKAAGTCPTLAEQRRLSVRTDFAASINGPVAPSALTADQRGNLLRIFPAVEEWMDAVREAALHDAVAGRLVPAGFHVVEGKRGNRAWTDETRATQVLEATLGDEAYARKLISPTVAEKLLGKGLVDGLVSQAPGKPALAPLDDGKADYSKQSQARADFVA